MNWIRGLMTAFIVIVIGLSIAGWNWAGRLPYPNIVGSRVALMLCSVMAIGALSLLWRSQQGARQHDHH